MSKPATKTAAMPAAAPQSPPATVARKSRILIADDNPTNVELLEVYLSEIECDTAIAVDGRDTLDKVASFQPDLILLDIMMPEAERTRVASSSSKIRPRAG